MLRTILRAFGLALGWLLFFIGAVLGEARELKQSLEHAGPVADFLEFTEQLCHDALERNESCGGHFMV